MIISKDIPPQKDIYYLGAQILKIAYQFNQARIAYEELLREARKELNISPKLFTLCIDWLFLIDAVASDSDYGYICLPSEE